MTFNYGASAITALNLITKFGRTIQHVSITEGTYDPATSSVTNTTTSTDVQGCDFEADANMYQRGVVQFGDRYCLIGQGVQINVSDQLIIDGVTWAIYKVEKLAPASTVVLWKAFIRK
jgi:hypothetical protein